MADSSRSTRPIDMVVHHHVGSFNFFLEQGLERAVELLEPEEVSLTPPEQAAKLAPKDRTWLRFWIEDVKISTPSKAAVTQKLYPSECRVSGSTYAAPFFAVIASQINDGPITRLNRLMGRLPIMLRVRPLCCCCCCCSLSWMLTHAPRCSRTSATLRA